MAKRTLIHSAAVCCVCGKIEDDMKKSREWARTHHRDTGHRVDLETTYLRIYEKDENPIETSKKTS